ncbi:MAG: preprotein translocase subunit SecY [Acidobacteriota bacterium]
MITTLRNILAIPELRRRLLFTFALLAVYRLGCHLPLPGIDLEVLRELMTQMQGSLLNYFNVFSGGSVERAAVFALGILPYISASIMLQVLTVVVPHLEKLSKEGEAGRQKITRYTRYGALLIAAVQSTSIAWGLEQTLAPGGALLVPSPGWGFRLTTMLTLTAGCAVVMWLGEQMTQRGLGNGISLIIFAGIVVTLPQAAGELVSKLRYGHLSWPAAAMTALFFILLTGFIVFMERSQRRIPVQYAKRVMGRHLQGGQRTYLPLKVNTGGVIPVIFASSVLVIPGTLAGLLPADWAWVRLLTDAIQSGQPAYYVLLATAIVLFSFVYVSIVFNPQDTASNMRRHGGFVPGIRSGRPTAELLDRTLTRLTMIGAVYLAGVVILPELLIYGLRVDGIPWLGAGLEELLPGWLIRGIGLDLTFGGTSILIVVAVATDFVHQVESHLVTHSYDKLLKQPRGRR